MANFGIEIGRADKKNHDSAPFDLRIIGWLYRLVG